MLCSLVSVVGVFCCWKIEDFLDIMPFAVGKQDIETFQE
jgi:hypothetical protein